MNRKAVIGLCLCAALVVAGLFTGGAGAFPTSATSAIAALGLAGLFVVGLLELAGILARRRAAPETVSNSPEVRSVIEVSTLLADAVRERGFLVLMEAPASCAWGLLRLGCGRVIRADDPAAIRRDFVGRVTTHVDRASRVRARLSVLCAAAGVLSLLCVFVLLVESVGFAMDASSVDFGAGLAIAMCVYAAFVVVIAGLALVDRMARADERDAIVAILVVEAVLALRAGLTGRDIRTLLESLVERGLDTTLPDRPARAIAA